MPEWPEANCPNVLPMTVLWLWHLRGNWGRACRLPESRRWSWESREPKQPEFVIQSTREERMHSERTSEICIEPSVHASTTHHVKKLPEAEERTTWKDWKKKGLVLTQDWEQCLQPPVRLKKLIIHGTWGEVLRRVLPQQWGMTSHKLCCSRPT